jgi:hypothetical protein
MNLLQNRIAREKTSEYATRDDFRKLFTEGMTSLYLLSFLLTANHEEAERCVVFGMEDCVEGTSVFREWARSWIRRTIVHNAIRLMAPHTGRSNGSSVVVDLATDNKLIGGQEATIATVLSLAFFERVVFVMTVLERHSDYDCSVLLGSALQDVRKARAQALQTIARSCQKNTETERAASILPVTIAKAPTLMITSAPERGSGYTVSSSQIEAIRNFRFDPKTLPNQSISKAT